MSILNKKIQEKIKKIPDKPGVYLFYNSKKELIYIGKASSLKNRVKSYFLGKYTERPIETMSYQIAGIKYITASSALEAIILEGNLIKKHLPKYNVLGKDDKSWNYITISKDEYPKVSAIREKELSLLAEKQKNNKFLSVFGPYPGLNTKEVMKIFRRMFNVSFCAPKLKSTKKSIQRPCFYRQMGECLGVCTGEISAKDYRKKVINPLRLFLLGKKEKLIKKIKSEMILASKNEDYEEAGRLRDRLKYLKRIQDIALINDSFVKDKPIARLEKYKIKRIEGYDISNLGVSGKVGVMVVFDSQNPIKSEYRKFNIYSVKGQSDIGCLKEVMARRFSRKDWLLPDIILVDGGKAQIGVVQKVMLEKNLAFPIIGIAKGPKRIKNDFYWFIKSPEVIEWMEKNKNLLIRVRDEAHRFAISFQRQKRKIK